MEAHLHGLPGPHPGERADVLEGPGDARARPPVRREPREILVAEPEPAPATGATPVMALKSVVLPAPFGPMIPYTSPRATENDTSSRATSPPNRTRRSSTRSSGAVPALRLAGPGSGAADRPRPTAPAPHRPDQAVRPEHRRPDQEEPVDQEPVHVDHPEHLRQRDQEPRAHHGAEGVPAAAHDQHRDDEDRLDAREVLGADVGEVVREEAAGQPGQARRHAEGRHLVAPSCGCRAGPRPARRRGSRAARGRRTTGGSGGTAGRSAGPPRGPDSRSGPGGRSRCRGRSAAGSRRCRGRPW